MKAWADSQNDQVIPATNDQIARHLSFLDATLPSKSVNDEGGKMRFAVYARLLSEYSNEAIAYMAREACKRFDWFPTPRQCIDLLSEYRAPAGDKEVALMLCHNFWQARFESFIASLQNGTATQDQVDAVKEQWRRIAVERGYLRRMEDGGYVICPRKNEGAA